MVVLSVQKSCSFRILPPTRRHSRCGREFLGALLRFLSPFAFLCLSCFDRLPRHSSSLFPFTRSFSPAISFSFFLSLLSQSRLSSSFFTSSCLHFCLFFLSLHSLLLHLCFTHQFSYSFSHVCFPPLYFFHTLIFLFFFPLFLPFSENPTKSYAKPNSSLPFPFLCFRSLLCLPLLSSNLPLPLPSHPPPTFTKSKLVLP